MAKKKPIYAVYCMNGYGLGMQAVKANNKIEARRKFRKRFPKSRIVDVEKYDSEHPHSSTFLNHAI